MARVPVKLIKDGDELIPYVRLRDVGVKKEVWLTNVSHTRTTEIVEKPNEAGGSTFFIKFKEWVGL